MDKLIQPFAGWRPRPELVEQASAPPYDVMNSAEAREMAAGNPHSFLRVSRAEIELAEGTSPYDEAVYGKAAENYARMCAPDGVLIQDPAPCLYLYRLVMDGREQVGVAAAASVAAYDADRIKKHEFTRPDKENDRTRFALEISAHSGPVFLTYRKSPRIDELVAAGMASDPAYDFTAPDGVRHTLWVVDDESAIAALTAAFEALPSVYVADGHHRSAAASRVRRFKQEQLGDAATGEEPFNRFLSVLFPDDQMRILDYNRVVRDLNGLAPEAFLARLEEAFEVTPSAVPYSPDGPHRFGMYLDGAWYGLTLKPGLVDESDPVGRLDVSLLSVHLLEPILGIEDPRRDKRIDFVGGIRGLQGLETRVDSGEMAVAFSMYATSLADLMAVADSGNVMPPKSTWFEPKLRDGLVIQGF